MPKQDVVYHDYANLLCMPILGLLCTVACLDFIPTSFALSVLLVYMCIDFVWIAAVPSCVPKAQFILLHHVITTAMIIIALCNLERIGFYASLDGTVELNTFFLIARRSFPVKSWQPLFDTLYWATWVPLRLLMYPYVLYLIPVQLSDDMLLVSMLYPCQAFLVCFNGWLLYKTWPRSRKPLLTKGADEATTARKIAAITAGH